MGLSFKGKLAKGSCRAQRGPPTLPKRDTGEQVQPRVWVPCRGVPVTVGVWAAAPRASPAGQRGLPGPPSTRCCTRDSDVCGTGGKGEAGPRGGGRGFGLRRALPHSPIQT